MYPSLPPEQRVRRLIIQVYKTIEDAVNLSVKVAPTVFPKVAMNLAVKMPVNALNY